MTELFLIALLVWLWVVERRLNGLTAKVRHLQQDLDGLRIREIPRFKREDSDLPGLPEVTPLEPADAAETPAAAVH